MTQVCLCLKWMTGEQHIKPALGMPDVPGHNRGEQISWFLCPLFLLYMSSQAVLRAGYCYLCQAVD